MTKFKKKTFGPNITFRDGSTYPLSSVIHDFLDEYHVSEEITDVDDHGAKTVEYVFKDPETGNFYKTEAYVPRDWGYDFCDLHGDLLTCFQVEPVQIVTTIYKGVPEDE